MDNERKKPEQLDLPGAVEPAEEVRINEEADQPITVEEDEKGIKFTGLHKQKDPRADRGYPTPSSPQ